ncbi:MAG: MBL fold metallo-hydrolase [Candidatus Kapabacteria bacterium]|nr:MBL fold metallo-hydrolase [Candidatus Kapabacteria bacterium]
MRLIAPNVWQISGFPSNIINTYLIADGDDVVLIDAGTRYMTNRILRTLKRFFAEAEHKTKRLFAHALTHVHPDHQGASKAVCDSYGVPLWCGDLDAEPMERGLANSPDAQGVLGLLMRVWSGSAHTVARRLQEGDMVAGFRVLDSPGHSAGHISFWREADKCLILGDVLNGMNLMTGLPGLNEPPVPFTTDVPQNRRSIRKLAALKPDIICFGHGAPLIQKPHKLEEFMLRLPA